jgi:diguanylate cyclase (GGDEF)-like protein/PAS domain S-box-containing protein
MKKRHFFYSLLLILLLIVGIAGYIATDSLGNKARREIISENQAALETLSIYVTSTFTNIEGAVKSLAGSPWIAPALIAKSKQNIENAQSALDRYNSTINASVSYLMDAEGLTVASSNRKDPDSFVGKSYYFRPYFQEALQGQPGRYFALGVTSGNRGFYASHPVRNHLGKMLGVVAMKKDLDELEAFFSRYPLCFFVSPEGIIFLASKPEMVLKSFWPLEKTLQDKLLASRQYGQKPFESVFLKKEIVDGTAVAWEGKDYFVSRKVIDRDGWSIILLAPTDRIKDYQLLGVLAAISLSLLIIVFSVVIFFIDRSRIAIRQSEESKRMLLQAVAEGIFGVDAAGRVTFVNPAALRLLGFSEAEMTGQSIHELIHHSHQDGSRYPAEDCPMHAPYTKGTECAVTNEVLWRKDGSSFPVEYSSTPIISDSMVIGAVVNFRNVTERREAEETLRENESRLRAITDSAQDAILMMDPAGRISYWNPAAERIFGYTSAEALGQNLHLLIVPSRYLAVHHAAFPIFQQTGQGAAVGKTLDLEARRKDGKEISVQLSLAVIQMKGAWHAVGILRDITERRQAEEALKKMGAILTEMGAIAKIGGWEFDAVSQKQVWTPEVYHIHEVAESYEPTVSKGIEFYTPSSRPLIEKAVQSAIEYGDPFDVELEIITAKGNHRWVHAKGNTERANGVTKKVFGFFQDITNRKRAEEKLRESETRQSILLANLPAGVVIIDPVTRLIEMVNNTAAVMFGAAAEHIVGHRCHKFLCPAIEGACPVCDLGKEVDNAEREMVCADGSRLPVLKSVKRVQIGGQEKLLECFVEISAQKRAEAALKCSETKFRTLYDSNSDAVMLLSRKGFFDCNKAALKMFGCATLEEFCLKHPADLSPNQQPDGTDSLVQANQMIASAIERGSIQFEWIHQRNDNGETFPADVSLTAMELNGKPVVQAVVRDITSRKQTEEKIRQLAYHDSLTGLPNRKLFSDRLSITLAQAQRNQQKVGIAMLDLDKFKDVNDTLGHDAGDLLLQETAKRLSAALRKGDTVARLGGDEFVLILNDLKGADDVIPVAQKIVDSFCQPFPIGTRQLTVTTSMGIAVYPDDGIDEGILLKNADIAMYKAKQAGRARYQIYKETMNSE